MAKIAKNIKALRIEKRVTQEELAKSINVTRQTISSWETDRTQPDIGMLETLSEFFGVGIEELIYGEKRNVGLEADPKKSRKVFSVVLAVLGSLFTVVGLVILFVDLWKDFSLSLKTALSFLPLIIGFLTALLVLYKKKESVPWREGAAVVWAAGLIATNALICVLYEVRFIDYILLVDAVLVLPMIIILGAVFPLTLYFGLITFIYANNAYSYYGFGADRYGGVFLLLQILFLAVGYAFIIRNKDNDARRHFSVWLGIAAAGFHLPIMCGFFGADNWDAAMFIVPAILLALYLFDNGERPAYPFRYPAVTGTVALATAYNVFFLTNSNNYIKFEGYGANISVFAVYTLAIAAGAFLGRKNLVNNPLKIAFAVCAALIPLFLMTDGIYIIFPTLLMDIIVVIAGIKTAKLSTTNLGLAGICVVALLIIFGSEMNTVVKGIACIAIGITLILINYFMSKFFASQKKNKEVADNA